MGVEYRDGTEESYKLRKFARTNMGTCINQYSLVRKGDRVRGGQAIVEGAATEGGALALGKNLLVAFLPWEGYNYEDAILISERLVIDDSLTSLHIEKYECEARDTKLGPEEITRDIPNVGDDALKDLARRSPRQSRIVELRVFVGLTLRETAGVEGISATTAAREWRTAKLFLYRLVRG